ncbi:homoserine kinase [Polynucleobacter sp. SHI8]|uniref:homoserine kinase n=1 Tax=unclassified Polynucleobacter TaxID=2640945 RepID=UPI00248FC765|nr:MULTISPECIES: homoserine kinase [unclassified Polynucleobacter]BDW11898.1 homoserine kinase [Polynucleobacter sp. SHI2]BDW14345.1 homoserine kinase [Polynucleobacter sp. SHI8]
MAVYTTIAFEDAQNWLSQTFDLGQLTHLTGISGGIENTNYFLDVTRDNLSKQYVLTIFERLEREQLPFYLNLMAHLSAHDIKVPTPYPNRDGVILQSLANKPAVIVSKLAGSARLNPLPNHCSQVGEMLAKMHLAGKSYPNIQENLRSLPWWKSATQEILPFIDNAKQVLLKSELEIQDIFFNSPVFSKLPAGACHCDLFRDNVLFKDNEELSGFFDFYFAGTDKWLFDLAVTANDWCINLETGVFDQARLQALLNSYEEVRPLTIDEKNSWQLMLRAAALRFWISRLWDFYIPRNAQLLTPHNPTHFETILRLRIKDDTN